MHALTPLADVASIRAALDSGDIDEVQLTEQTLARCAALNSQLGAFSAFTAERALEEAHAARARRAAGHPTGPLHGIPYAVKDLLDVAGEITTAGTHVLASNRAASDCEVVCQLSALGMILIGKTQTTQLACSTTGVNPDFATPLNPWHREPHLPGGSSSGSAVAVSAGMVPIALGTDTGGSVRIPAALCGTVGLKTTVGRVSTRGIYPLCPTLDSVGPLTNRVADAALVLRALDVRAGEAVPAATHPAVTRTVAGQQGPQSLRGLHVAVDESFLANVEPVIADALEEGALLLQRLGARLVRVRLPSIAQAMAIDWWPDFLFEAQHSNRALLHHDAEQFELAARWIFGPKGTEGAYRAMLHRRRDLVARSTSEMADIDVLLAPTTTITTRPLAVAERWSESLEHQFARNARLGNMLDFCGVTVPAGIDAHGSPVGLTFYACAFGESSALRAACAFERATRWHLRRPDLSWINPPSAAG